MTSTQLACILDTLREVDLLAPHRFEPLGADCIQVSECSPVVERVRNWPIRPRQADVDGVAVRGANGGFFLPLVSFEPSLRVECDDGVEVLGSGPVVLRLDGGDQFVTSGPPGLVQFDTGVVRKMSERAGDELRETTPAVTGENEFTTCATDWTGLILVVAVVLTGADGGSHRDERGALSKAVAKQGGSIIRSLLRKSKNLTSF